LLLRNPDTKAVVEVGGRPVASRRAAEWNGSQLGNATWRVEKRRIVSEWAPYDGAHPPPRDDSTELRVIQSDGEGHLEWRTVGQWKPVGSVKRTRTTIVVTDVAEPAERKKPRRRPNPNGARTRNRQRRD
jgi:hypothetical protein